MNKKFLIAGAVALGAYYFYKKSATVPASTQVGSTPAGLDPLAGAPDNKLQKPETGNANQESLIDIVRTIPSFGLLENFGTSTETTVNPSKNVLRSAKMNTTERQTSTNVRKATTQGAGLLVF